MKTKVIEFRSLQDFQNRIAQLWQNQQDDETYDFIFPNAETEKAFEELVNKFE